MDVLHRGLDLGAPQEAVDPDQGFALPEPVGCAAVAKRAERISMYTLRHSCATHWLREGKSLIWVNRLLRHSQVQTTMEYVHLAGVDLQEMR